MAGDAVSWRSLPRDCLVAAADTDVVRAPAVSYNRGMNTILQVRAAVVPSLVERVLSVCFQLLAHAMRAAAHFSGIAQQQVLARSVGGLLGAEALAAPDLPALLCSDLPLPEIAAAERERLARLVAAETTSAAEEPREQRVLH